MLAAAGPISEADLSALVERVRDAIGVHEGAVSLHEPEFSGSEWEMVKDCLDTGWVSSVGKYVDRFEEMVAEFCGAAYAVATVNGTAALQIALQVAGVKPGDEVLMPSLTFVATANAAVHAGAGPHFVDVSPHTLGLDPQALARHLDQFAERRGGELFNRRTGRRFGAIVPMHVFGHPVDMAVLLEVADFWNIPVIEDAAEALGSQYRGKPCGGLGMIGAVSFNGNKIVTTGGGGAIVTNDPALARRAKHLTTTAKLPHRWAFDHDEVGYNYRLPNLNAALGCAQLEQLPQRLMHKRSLAARYVAAFHGYSQGQIFEEPEGCDSNYWLNTLLLAPGMPLEPALSRLNDEGLMARPAWTPLHNLPMYRDAPRADLPVTEDLAARIISLPSSAKLGA